MDADGLRPKDLVTILGSESVVPEVLHRKRDLNKTRIAKLSKQFQVSPAVFFPRLHRPAGSLQQHGTTGTQSQAA